uniref:B30.2/SPRY domain-containing protein n=2 Tax=Lutzomyia longipalpis TaxID=7200 RepID=A0A1B0CNZ8_LUTLO
MGLLSMIYADIERSAKVPPFCGCFLRQEREDPTRRYIIDQCRCGEEHCDVCEWSWDANIPHPDSHINNRLVNFHPVYSQGTAMVRGTEPLRMGMCHYWEIKMMSPVSGTDMMVGVGTDKVDLTSHQYTFGSTLGLDEHSWGYSYRGVVLHSGRSYFFGKKFTQGSIVGVLLNLRRGTMELYINRVPQGQAFHDLPTDPNVKLYPMLSSTAAKSQMKLLNAVSFEENLQYHAMRTIYRHPQLLAELQTYPMFDIIVKRFWFLRQTDDAYNTDTIDRISKRQQQPPENLENAMMSPVSGTDMMVGVGTDKVDLTSHQYTFGSTLGLDEHSWGYSYRGVVLHSGRSYFFGKKFTQGSIVGVLLNLRRGTMELYINRVPQGQAFHDLPTDPNVKLYPMLSSTAAKSQMKLLNAVSFEENLQYHAMRTIYRHPQLLAELQTYPMFDIIVKRFWFLRQTDDAYNTDTIDRISKRQQQPPENLENAVLLKNLGEGTSKATKGEPMPSLQSH